MSTLFDGSGDGPCRQQLREQLAKHELPDAASWTAAAFERWEEIHASGEDVQSFFRLEPEEARPFLEDLGQRLATIVAGEPELFGPAVVSRLDSLGTAEARKYLREISAEFIEEKRQADIGEVLGAAIGDWPLVAQDRDFRRQLEPELLARLDEATQPGLLVILGNAGAGKTTLLRRLGRELLGRGRRVLELRSAARKSSDWVASVPQPDASGPPCILIDDVFRCDGIEDIVAEGNTFTIIGTSRMNEDQTSLLRFSSEFRRIGSRWPTLTEPTADELETLRRLPELRHFTDAEWRRIATVTRGGVARPAPLLVVLLQVAAAGKPYDEIVSNSVASLGPSSLAWRAYGAICAFHQFGVAVPTEPLLAILHADRAAFLTEQEHGRLRGMVFRADAEAESWVTAHELLAESAAELAYGGLVDEYHDAAFAMAKPTAVWWRLLLDLVRALIRAKQNKVAHALTAKYAATIQAMLDADATRRCDWARLLPGLTPGEDARDAVRACITGAVPGSPAQLIVLVEIKKSLGAKEREELEIIEPYIDAYPSAFVVERYLKLVVAAGDGKERTKAVARAIVWTHDPEAHPNVLTVALPHLDREPEVTDEQRAEAAARVYAWAKAHPQSLVVWRVLLKHYRDGGDSTTAAEVLSLARKYFPEDRNFISVYIATFDQELAPETVEELYEGLLTRMPQDSAVASEYVKWLDRHGFAEKALAVGDRVDAGGWQQNYGFRYRYGMLLLRAGRLDDAERQAHVMIESARSEPLGHSVLGTVLARRAVAKQQEGDPKAASALLRGAETAYRRAIQLARAKGEQQSMFLSLLGALYLSFEAWADAYDTYRRAASDEDRDSIGHYIGMARAAAGQRHWRDAEGALRKAAKQTPAAMSAEGQQRWLAMLDELSRDGVRILPELVRQVKAKVAAAPIKGGASVSA